MQTDKSTPPASHPVIRKVSRGFQITLPPEFRAQHGLDIGDHVRIEQHGDSLIITAISDERQRLADELLATLTNSESDIDDAEAMRIAINEIKRHRQQKQKNKQSPPTA